MAEKDEGKEKETRTRIDTRTGEVERESRTRTSEGESSSDTGRGRSRYARWDTEDTDSDDPDSRKRRRDLADVGENLRGTSQSVRRAGSDFLTSGCDILGDLFIGLGNAISGRRSGSSSSSSSSSSSKSSSSSDSGNCIDEFGLVCKTFTRNEDGGCVVASPRTRQTSRD